MINTMIFDIGKVLIQLDWDSYINRLFDDKTAKIVTKAMWESRYWCEFDRAVWSTEDVLKAFVSYAPGYEKEIKTAYEHVGECLHKCDYSIGWIKSLKSRGYKVLFLSNYFEELINKNRDVLDFIPYMDGGVFSYQINKIKPDREIYQYICDKYSLVPSECLFTDDCPANISGAKSFGFNAVLFESYEKTKPLIEKFLNNSPITSAVMA